MTEEEVTMEVEAVQAVYSEDCVVLDSYPPHLHLHIKPRTAEISSQQFVEATVKIQAGSKYPDEPPQISLIESKGLDDHRQKHLMGIVQDKAAELSSSLMLVELCEEAIERLTIMNHPDGDCPLCLYPLFPEDGQRNHMPFMKLMSCFHCFHCECIIRWWNWLHTQQEADSKPDDLLNIHRETTDQEGKSESANKSLGNCPVCRKVFHARDLEHVLDLVGAQIQSSQQDSSLIQSEDEDPLLQSDSENIRRERFESILKTQEERGGLVQPKKNLSVVPGMYLPPPVTLSAAPALSSNEEAGQEVEEEHKAESETNSGSSSNRTESGRGRGDGRGRGQGRNANRRKQSSEDPRKSTKQWVQRS